MSPEPPYAAAILYESTQKINKVVQVQVEPTDDKKEDKQQIKQ